MSILGTQPNHTMLDPNSAMSAPSQGICVYSGLLPSSYSPKTQLLYIPASAPERECDMIA